MKTTLKMILMTTTLLGTGSTRALADDEAWAALGGFVAGVITQAVIEDSRDHQADVRVIIRDYDHRDYRHHRDYGDRRDHRCNKHCDHRDRRDHCADGYWKVEHVKIWVPGGWEVGYNRCGDKIRTWRKGHYVVEKRRVWVAHHDRHDRRYRG